MVTWICHGERQRDSKNFDPETTLVLLSERSSQLRHHRMNGRVPSSTDLSFNLDFLERGNAISQRPFVIDPM